MTTDPTTIGQLPAAVPITGTDIVPIEQAGKTVRTTVAGLTTPPLTDWNFQVTQGAGPIALTATGNTLRKYVRTGWLVTATAWASINGPGVLGQGINVPPPVPALLNGLPYAPIGTFIYFRSGTAWYTGAIDTGGNLWVHNSGNVLGVSPSFAAAAGDTIAVDLSYIALTL